MYDYEPSEVSRRRARGDRAARRRDARPARRGPRLGAEGAARARHLERDRAAAGRGVRGRGGRPAERAWPGRARRPRRERPVRARPVPRARPARAGAVAPAGARARAGARAAAAQRRSRTPSPPPEEPGRSTCSRRARAARARDAASARGRADARRAGRGGAGGRGGRDGGHPASATRSDSGARGPGSGATTARATSSPRRAVRSRRRSPSEPADIGLLLDRLRAASTVLFREPGGEPRLRITPQTEWGSPRVLGVVGQRGDWLGVQASELKNGEVAWIPRERATRGLRALVAARRPVEARAVRAQGRAHRAQVARSRSARPGTPRRWGASRSRTS